MQQSSLDLKRKSTLSVPNLSTLSPRTKKYHWNYLRVPGKCSKLKRAFHIAYWMVLAMNRMKDNSRYALTDQQYRMCREVYDKMDGHSIENVLVALGDLGLYPTMDELEDLLRDTGSIHVPFNIFTRILEVLKKRWMAERVDDTVEAFIALGGAKDGSGCVAYDNLKAVVKDFELGIDIEKFIADNDTDGNGQMDYSEFVTLFSESASWRKKSEYEILLNDEERMSLSKLTSDLAKKKPSESSHAAMLAEVKPRDLPGASISSLSASVVSISPMSMVTINPTPIVELPRTPESQLVSVFVSEARRKLQSLTAPLVPSTDPAQRSPKAANRPNARMFDFVSEAGMPMSSAAVVAGETTVMSTSLPKRAFVSQTHSTTSIVTPSSTKKLRSKLGGDSSKKGRTVMDGMGGDLVLRTPPAFKTTPKRMAVHSKGNADEITEDSSIVMASGGSAIAAADEPPEFPTHPSSPHANVARPITSQKKLAPVRPISRDSNLSVEKLSRGGSGGSSGSKSSVSRHLTSSESRLPLTLLPAQFRNLRSQPTHKPTTLIRGTFPSPLLAAELEAGVDYSTTTYSSNASAMVMTVPSLAPVSAFQHLVNRNVTGTFQSHVRERERVGAPTRVGQYLAAATPFPSKDIATIAAYVLAQLPPIGINYDVPPQPQHNHNHNNHN